MADPMPGSMAEFAPQTRASHTPGPWQVLQGSEARDFIVAERSGNTVCEPNTCCYDFADLDPSVRTIDLAEAKANARLIAAAPDMAALLLEVRDFVDNYVDVVDGENGPRPNTAMALDTAIRDLLDRAGVAHAG